MAWSSSLPLQDGRQDASTIASGTSVPSKGAKTGPKAAVRDARDARDASNPVLSPEHPAFSSPAVALLCELEDAALANGQPLTVTFTADGKMRIAPLDILTPSKAARVRECREHLAALVRHSLALQAPEAGR